MYALYINIALAVWFENRMYAALSADGTINSLRETVCLYQELHLVCMTKPFQPLWKKFSFHFKCDM